MSVATIWGCAPPPRRLAGRLLPDEFPVPPHALDLRYKTGIKDIIKLTRCFGGSNNDACMRGPLWAAATKRAKTILNAKAVRFVMLGGNGDDGSGGGVGIGGEGMALVSVHRL